MPTQSTCFHVDNAEAQTAEGKLYLCATIDSTSKVTPLERRLNAGKMAVTACRSALIAAVPYRLTIELPPFSECKTSLVGQRAERTNCTISYVTVKRVHYDQPLRDHMANVIRADTLGR